MPGIQDFIQLIASNIWIYGGSFLLVLSVLVFVHEMGHYLVARWCGVRIETFSIGFGKEIWGFQDKHGTHWKVSMVPLGGYVKMFGDTDPASAGQTDKVQDGNNPPRSMTAEERGEAFFAKKVWQRFLIVLAGPGINYLFAILLLSGLYAFHGQAVTPPEAAGIIRESAADIAGIQPHDRIIMIGGHRIQRFEDIRREIAVNLDQETEVVVLRDGQKISFMATPLREETKDRHGFHQSRGLLGVLSAGNGVDISKITMIDGVQITDVDQARQMLIERMDQVFLVTLAESDDNGMTLTVRPKSENNAGLTDSSSPDYNALVLGVKIEDDILQHGPVDAVVAATQETYKVTISTLQAIGQIFTGTRSAKELGGIIRIGAIAGDMAQMGIVALVGFTALLSINLGLINMFPIPMLDGGHLVFYAAEALRGKPISERIQEYAFRLGLAILVGIMVFANLNDILQLAL